MNNVIQHAADMPSLDKSKEHPDPLNPLGDQELSDRASDYTSEFTLQSKRKSSKSSTHGNRNMAHLEICNPPILRKSVEACKKEMEGQLLKLVDDLINDLYYNAPRGCIPLKLRVSKMSVARYTP